MDEEIRHPIYSTLTTSPGLEDPIHHFVVGLAEQVDMLQDDEQNSDYESLEERAALIADEADRMGFPEFSRVAQKIAAACSEEFKDTLQQGLVELTEIGRRIRLGHRGAA